MTDLDKVDLGKPGVGSVRPRRGLDPAFSVVAAGLLRSDERELRLMSLAEPLGATCGGSRLVTLSGRWGENRAAGEGVRS